MAFQNQISINDFWTMTPWIFYVAIRANNKRRELEHNKDAFMMYHNALLYRMKKMPPLSDFTIAENKKPIKTIDETAIISRLKAYKKRYEKEKPCLKSQP